MAFSKYANTWSLYLLVCLILLAMKEKRRPIDWPAMAALLCGVFLSGSRGVFLLLLPLGLAWNFHQLVVCRDARTTVLTVGAAILAGALSTVLSQGLVLDRLRAITLSSSSLNGRLLYDFDGLKMLAHHPMGVGYGGYLYLQALEQTGVYTLRLIHNEYLQATLDGGLPAGLCMTALCALMLFRRGTPPRERAVVFAIPAHVLIDFDLQFSAMAFLLLLYGSGGQQKQLAVPRRDLFAALCTVCAAVFSYFSLVYLLDFCGRSAAAYRLFPADLSLAESRLQSFPDVEAAEPVADAILHSTDLSMLAWDCKLAAAQSADLSAMAEYKYRYLCLNRYRGEVYQDFTTLLENASAKSSGPELARFKALAQATITQLEEVNRFTSPLAYRIADKPELGFSTQVYARLNQLIERIDTP